MQPGMTAKIAAADVDPFALQQPPVVRRSRRRRTILFSVLGIVTYLIGLIALIPARALLTEGDNLKVGGTIWNGEAVLASTERIEWTFAPLASLTRMGFSADWRMSGGGTDLAGAATQRGDVMLLENVSGQADGALLTAFAANLPLACNFVSDVKIRRLQLGGSAQEAAGTIRTSSARCSARGVAAPPIELPAMRAEFTPGANGTRGSLVTASGRVSLIELRLSQGGALSIWPTAAAIQRAPVLAGKRYDTTVQ